MPSRVRLFCDPMDYRLPGSSVHGISQARILEWVAISFSRGSSRPRGRTQVSPIKLMEGIKAVGWDQDQGWDLDAHSGPRSRRL